VGGAIGLESSFHQTFGNYGQDVVVATACLPEDWQDRVAPFAIALLAAGLVDPEVLAQRAGSIPQPEAVRARVRSAIAHYVRRAATD